MTSLIKRRGRTLEQKCVAFTLAVRGLATVGNVQTGAGEKKKEWPRSEISRDLISEEAPFHLPRFSDLLISVFVGSQSEKRNTQTEMLSLGLGIPGKALSLIYLVPVT